MQNNPSVSSKAVGRLTFPIKFWKKTTSITLILVMIFMVSSFQTIAEASENLVIYYPFDGNANDEIGSNDGTVHGATLTTDRHGNMNSAYSFDGSDDYIEPDNALGSSFFNNSFTFSIWIKVPTTIAPHKDRAGIVFGNWSLPTQSNSFAVAVNLTGGLRIYYGGGSNEFTDTDAELLDNTWHLITVVKENTVSNSKISTYIDGVAGEYRENVSFPSNVAEKHKIGADSRTSSDIVFQGAMDDIRIYDEALSASEILNLYREMKIRAVVSEALIFTIDSTIVNLNVDPSANSGQDYSQKTILTVKTNATSGYKIQGKLLDSSSNATLKSGSNTITAGNAESTENKFGYVGYNGDGAASPTITGTTTRTLAEIKSDINGMSSFTSNLVNLTNVAATAGDAAPTADGLSSAAATNETKHTIYYALNVDYLTPAGDL